MKRTPVRLDPFVQPLSRWSRLTALIGLLAMAASAWAQNLAFTTLAGTAGVTAPFNNSAPVTFNSPNAVAVDSAGNVYVADTSNHVIRKITAAGTVTTLVGAAGTPGTANDASANAPLARFNAPQGVALNAAGDRLYVADTGNHTIRVVALTAAGGSVTGVSTLAGSAGVSGSSDSGSGTFNTPRGIAADTLGNLYVSDTGNELIRKIVIAGPTVTTVAGLLSNTTFANGNNTQATFNSPRGIAVNAANDTLYVADFGNHVVRQIVLAGPAVTTYAGTATAGFIDANGTSAAFRNPTGVAVDASGNVLVVDFGNNALRQIAIAAGNAVTTLAGPAATGTSTAGAGGTANGTGSAVRFTGPIGLATKTVSSVAYVYVADTNNHLIRQGALPSLPTVGAASPSTQTTTAGTNGITFASTVTGGWPTPALQWQIQPGGVGTYQNLPANSTYLNVTTGTLTINGVTNAMNNDKFKLVATTSAAVEGAAGTLVVSQPPTFASGSVTFTAVVGRSNTFVVAAAGSSTITYSPSTLGVFSVAANGTITGTPTSTGDTVSGTITATNSLAPDAVQAVTINVVPDTSAAAPVITSAANATFVVGQNNSFTFTASGAPTPLIGLSGTLPAGVTFLNGLLTGVPFNTTNSPFTLTVNATNSVSSAVPQTFTLTVTTAASAPSFVTQPQNTVVNLGQSATFTAAVSGSPTPTLRWQRQASGSSGGFADLSDDSVYSGTATGTLVVSSLEAGMSGDQFRLAAVNASGTTYSSTVTVTVNVGTIISTFAGQAGVPGALDATGLAAKFNAPSGIAADASGNFYVADSANHVIRKITAGGVVTTFAGLAGVSGSVDGTGSDARFTGPSAIAVNSVGTVYVADTYNQIIRTISPGGVVTTVAGLANNSGSTDGVGANARFNYPAGIAIDASGVVYIADSSNHTVRRMQTNYSVSTFAGAAGIAGSTDNAIGTSARFNYPAHLATDSAGNVYVADTLNHTIRRISTTGAVTTPAGTAGVSGALDANGTAATFNRPTGVAVDSAGNLYVADTNNDTIRRIATSGTVTTLAGSAGIAGKTDGAGSLARFNQPFALTLDTNGNLYIADTRNHTIRRSGTTSSPGIATQPQNRVAVPGGTVTFTVGATGAPTPSYQWQRQAAGTSGFLNLSNGGSYSGVSTVTLTVANTLASNSGDQFRVVLNNGVNPTATSDAATLTIGDVPVFTNSAVATVRATDALNVTFTASGSPTSTFTAVSLPSWATLSSAGSLTGTPPAGSEGTYTFVVTASNGATATQSFTLTVTPAVLPPTIATPPTGASLNQGQTATFSVVATGTEPFAYQWRRNGVAIPGATAATLTLGNLQPANAGTYSVAIVNGATTTPVVSGNAELVVNTAPVLTFQPGPQVALAGSSQTFTVAATGSASFTYQWRKNGQPIAGATNATFTLAAVTAADAGNYDVQVTNPLGTVVSSLTQLTIVTSAVAPVITTQPAARAVLVGSPVQFVVGASGAPTPSYQWRKNGAVIAGATNATFTLASAQSGDNANYDVVATNSAGSATSATGNLRVFARSYAGIYFGTFTGNLGPVALHVRADNTGVFLGYAPGSSASIVSLSFTVGDTGAFSFTQGTVGTLAPIAVTGAIDDGGLTTGTVTGGASLAFNATRAPVLGSSQPFAGFYRAGAAVGAAELYVIAAANGQAFALVQSGNVADAGSGTVSASGAVTVTTSRSAISATIASAGTLSGSSTGAIVATFNGANEPLLALQRLANISTRARVGSGDSVAIAGFVIAGEQSKPVLIRAVGPSLGAAPFNLPALAAPKLELYRGTVVLASNSGIGTNRAAIDAAGAQVAAFPLGAAGTDAAILTTLAPGTYTAIVSSATAAAGVALIEVYDLSTPTPGQKMLNISTRAPAGVSENTLIAGFVVPPGTVKRVLVRGVGPGLAPFNLTGLLAQPSLTLFNGGTIVAQNTNWQTSADAAAITAASVQVGAFGLAANDSAMVVTLPAGNYTAQVLGVAGGTGIALIEVYELP